MLMSASDSTVSVHSSMILPRLPVIFRNRRRFRNRLIHGMAKTASTTSEGAAMASQAVQLSRPPPAASGVLSPNSSGSGGNRLSKSVGGSKAFPGSVTGSGSGSAGSAPKTAWSSAKPV